MARSNFSKYGNKDEFSGVEVVLHAKLIVPDDVVVYIVIQIERQRRVEPVFGSRVRCRGRHRQERRRAQDGDEEGLLHRPLHQ